MITTASPVSGQNLPVQTHSLSLTFRHLDQSLWWEALPQRLWTSPCPVVHHPPHGTVRFHPPPFYQQKKKPKFRSRMLSSSLRMTQPKTMGEGQG